MPGIYLRLETIAGGAIERGFADACAVAAKLGIWVMMNVNGIDTMIGPSDDPQVLNLNYERAVKLKRDFASATVPPAAHWRVLSCGCVLGYERCIDCRPGLDPDQETALAISLLSSEPKDR